MSLYFKILKARLRLFFTISIMLAAGAGLYGCASSDLDESVVLIAGSTDSFGANLRALGSGFVVARGGYIITNYHVIRSAVRRRYRKLQVLTEGANSKYYPASVVGYSEALDLALLRASDLKAPPLKINSGELKKLDSVTTIGFPAAAGVLDPNGLSITISSHAKGEISRVFNAYQTRYGAHVRAVQHNALVNNGNSGGPLINRCGQVVGVNARYSLIGQGTFFSIHSSELARFLKSENIQAYITDSRCSSSGGSSTTFWLIISVVTVICLILITTILLFWRRITRKLFGGTPVDESEYDDRSPVNNGETEFIGRDGKAGQIYQLRSVNGYEVFPLDPSMIGQSPMIIGRTAGRAGIEIDKPDISRQHARITVCVYDPNKLCLEDLKSRNGTRINGEPLSPGASPMIMRVGDNIQVGNQNFVFGRYSAQESARNVGQQTQATRVRVEADGWVLRGSDRATGGPISIDVGPDEMRSRNNQLVIGRNSDHCDIVIADPTVSSKGHAKIIFQNNEYRIADMGSTNGTRVDREKLEPGVNMAVLRDNMVLQLGSVELRVERRQG